MLIRFVKGKPSSEPDLRPLRNFSKYIMQDLRKVEILTKGLYSSYIIGIQLRPILEATI